MTKLHLITIHGVGGVACGTKHGTENFWLSNPRVSSGSDNNKEKRQTKRNRKQKTARFLAERQLFLIRPCSGSAALVLHTLCSQGFIAEALSVSSRSCTSTEVAAGVKAGEKVKPGRQRRRTKEEEKGSGEWAGETGKKQGATRKLKTQRTRKKKSCVLVDLTFMRIDLFCLPLLNKLPPYDVWQLLELLWSWLAGSAVRSCRCPQFK